MSRSAPPHPQQVRALVGGQLLVDPRGPAEQHAAVERHAAARGDPQHPERRARRRERLLRRDLAPAGAAGAGVRRRRVTGRAQHREHHRAVEVVVGAGQGPAVGRHVGRPVLGCRGHHLGGSGHLQRPRGSGGRHVVRRGGRGVRCRLRHGLDHREQLGRGRRGGAGGASSADRAGLSPPGRRHGTESISPLRGGGGAGTRATGGRPTASSGGGRVRSGWGAGAGSGSRSSSSRPGLPGRCCSRVNFDQ